MKRLLCAVLVVAAVLLSTQRAEDERLRFDESFESVPLPLSAAEKSRLTVIDTVIVMDEDEDGVAGVLVLYDDIRTKREIDYVELYNVIGKLAVVSWIDRFGICQTAMDRGLLDKEEPTIEGVLVVVTGGLAL
jgi:hypothetical protein